MLAVSGTSFLHKGEAEALCRGPVPASRAKAGAACSRKNVARSPKTSLVERGGAVCLCLAALKSLLKAAEHLLPRLVGSGEIVSLKLFHPRWGIQAARWPRWIIASQHKGKSFLAPLSDSCPCAPVVKRPRPRLVL